MHFKAAGVILLILFFPAYAWTQDFSSLDVSTLQGILRSFLDKKVRKAEETIKENSIKYVNKLHQVERDILKSFANQDSIHGISKSEVDEFYSTQIRLLNQPVTSVNQIRHYYTPFLDSVQGALEFITAENISQSGLTHEARSLLEEFNAVQSNLDGITSLDKVMNSRITMIMNSYPKDIVDRYKKRIENFSKDYSSKISAFKATYESPGKFLAGVFRRISQMERFQAFMSKNSMLASFFRLPGNGTPLNPGAIVGLQTRQKVEQLMASQLGVPGTSIEQQVNSLFQRSQSTMPQADNDSLKRLGRAGMPDARDGNQRGKTGRKQDRLGFGLSFQTTRNNGMFPVTIDLAGQVNYRMSEKFYAGIGVAYKLGLGNNFQSMKLTHEGVGIRSGLDFNIRKTFYISGGFEANYFKRISDLRQLHDFSQWQNSAMLGVMHKVRIGRASSTIHLLYDILHNRHTPRTQPVLFRFGYQF